MTTDHSSGGSDSGDAILEFDRVSVTYPGPSVAVLRDVTLRVGEAEMLLLVGPTGAGKSTLLRAGIGLVPHFSGGLLCGSVRVAGRDTAEHRPRDLADIAGFVAQRPTASFVTDIVEDELAYGMENLGLAPAVMRRRVEEVLDLLAIADLRDRSLDTLSGGQQQRVAIGAVLTTQPKLLLLDEPTSALDPAGAEEVLAALQRLCHDVGTTVVLAEHRLERVVHLVDRIAVLDTDGHVTVENPEQAMQHSPVTPPLVRLGRALDWHPLPLSIRTARRNATSTRETIARLATARLAHPEATPPRPESPPVDSATGGSATGRSAQRRSAAASLDRLSVRIGSTQVLRTVTFALEPGTVVAIMGRNGSGKTTLLSCLAGARRATSGSVEVAGHDPWSLTGRDRIAAVGLVPQDPMLLLYGSSVERELALADEEGGLEPGSTRTVLTGFGVELPAAFHPLDLSDGQRLLLAVAVVVGHHPRLLLLDEPTRGVDYAAKTLLATVLRSQAAAGACVVIATHDVELVAELADRVVVLADGEVITDGDARSVVCQSATLSPQVARIMAPHELLTVDEVLVALDPAGTRRS